MTPWTTLLWSALGVAALIALLLLWARYKLDNVNIDLSSIFDIDNDRWRR